jgi:hypothetical protein
MPSTCRESHTWSEPAVSALQTAASTGRMDLVGLERAQQLRVRHKLVESSAAALVRVQGLPMWLDAALHWVRTIICRDRMANGETHPPLHMLLSSGQLLILLACARRAARLLLTRVSTGRAVVRAMSGPSPESRPPFGYRPALS